MLVEVLKLLFWFMMVVFICGWGTSLLAQSYIELGPADIIALDQPRVTVEVYIPSPEHSFGPDIANSWLLDTAAQGLLSAGFATAEMKSAGYTTVAVFEELGIGGSVFYDVSEVYNFDFAGSNYMRNTLSDVRMLSSDTANFGSFGGIVGMPAMTGRVTSVDMTPMAGLDFINVAFPSSLPASSGHRYSAPLQLVDYPVTAGQQNPGDPLPTYAPLPFVNVEMQHAGNFSAGSFVLDTGAQMSLLSTQWAFDLGLDADDDGNFDNEAIMLLDLSGAGGSYLAPVLEVEKLLLLTAEGVDLIWTNVTVAIADIDPSIVGIFGNDLLTSAYLDNLGVGNGYIVQVHFDFTDSDNLNGVMYLDLNPDYDNVIPGPEMLPGDANGDGVVSADDYASVQVNFGDTGVPGIPGDATGDGVVSADDYGSVQMHFGDTGEMGSVPVPEPTTMVLLTLGVLGLLTRRRNL